jgi:hypothetical protein
VAVLAIITSVFRWIVGDAHAQRRRAADRRFYLFDHPGFGRIDVKGNEMQRIFGPAFG